jgi:hypothetical protein
MLARKKQAGLTMLSWLVVALVAMVAVTSLVKIGPIYLESWTVKSILNQVAEETRSESLNRGQIRERLEKKFFINTVKGITMQDVQLESSRGLVTIDANYEVRKRLFFNLDVVVVFDDMVISVQTA